DSLCALSGTTRGGVSVGFSPDGRKLFSVGDDGLVGIWDAGSKQELAKWRAQSDVSSAAFSQSGQYVALENHAGQLALWSVPRRELLARAQEQDTHESDRLIALSPDDKLLGSADRNQASVRLWSVPSLQPAPGVSAENDGVCALAFSPDGQWLAVGGNDGSI